MQHLAQLSFCREPHAPLSLALEKWFNKSCQQVKIASESELVFCSPNTVAIEGQTPSKFIKIPIERPVVIARVNREPCTLDPRIYEDGMASVKLGGSVVFTGPIEEAAKVVYQLLVVNADPRVLLGKSPLRTLASIIVDFKFPREIREAAEALRELIEPTSACIAVDYTRDSYRFTFTDPLYRDKKVEGSFAIQRMSTGYYLASKLCKPQTTEVFYCPYHRPLLRMVINDLNELLQGY